MTVAFRLRPSAAIVRGGSILLIEYDEPGVGLHYNLPGGGLDPEETIYEGLKRELREEAGVEVAVGALLMVWELSHGQDGPNHHVGLVFRCDLTGDSQPHMPEPADEFQIGVRWIPLADLPRIKLLPKLMAGKLMQALSLTDGFDPFVAENW